MSSGSVAYRLKRAVVIAFSMLAATPVLATEKRIKLRVAESGAYYLPVLINNQLRLEFQLDTGASIVTMPLYVGMTLYKSGSMADNDVGNLGEATLANGTSARFVQMRFKTMQIGSGQNAVVGRSIIGAVGDDKTSLLLGTTFLQQFKSFQIDHATNELVIDDAPNPNYTAPAFTPYVPQTNADIPATPQPPYQPQYQQPQPQYEPQQPYVQQPYYPQQPPPQYQQPQPYAQQPYYQPEPQPYYPPPPPAYYAPPPPCPACVVGGVLGSILGGALIHRGYGGWGGYRGGYGRGWHR